MSLRALFWDSFVSSELWQWLTAAIGTAWWAKMWPILLDKGLLALIFFGLSYQASKLLERYKVAMAFHVELHKKRMEKVVELWNSLAEQETYLISESDKWHALPEVEQTEDALAEFISRLNVEVARHSIAVRKASLFVGRGVYDEAREYTEMVIHLSDDLVKGTDSAREKAKNQLWEKRQRLLNRVLLLANLPLHPPTRHWLRVLGVGRDRDEPEVKDAKS